ncbi:MAG: shikimate kinase [Ferruginibacter sp.]|nr:shikimate kinase [Bacteroidota bacterium]MBX2919340.1 shikimate kinase [Ferruginibacter sp.]MCB0709407.1 shikimate kinase [Chitinophagaceae bacterium]MCC7377790.1 shikimate kinase [Chitinophagaceae bacterium]
MIQNTAVKFPSGHIGKIFLVGFMGSGKTFWGRKWSQQYKLPFFDLDEEIEKAEKKTIAEIFEKDGEEFFRKMELHTLKSFSAMDNCIIACGGGTPCFADNMQWMNENGKTVYLKASPQNIYQKLINEKDKRPLVKNLTGPKLLSFIEEKLQERELYYRQAYVILQVDEMGEDFVPGFIADYYQNK